MSRAMVLSEWGGRAWHELVAGETFSKYICLTPKKTQDADSASLEWCPGRSILEKTS